MTTTQALERGTLSDSQDPTYRRLLIRAPKPRGRFLIGLLAEALTRIGTLRGPTHCPPRRGSGTRPKRLSDVKSRAKIRTSTEEPGAGRGLRFHCGWSAG